MSLPLRLLCPIALLIGSSQVEAQAPTPRVTRYDGENIPVIPVAAGQDSLAADSLPLHRDGHGAMGYRVEVPRKATLTVRLEPEDSAAFWMRVIAPRDPYRMPAMRAQMRKINLALASTGLETFTFRNMSDAPAPMIFVLKGKVNYAYRIRLTWEPGA